MFRPTLQTAIGSLPPKL